MAQALAPRRPVEAEAEEELPTQRNTGNSRVAQARAPRRSVEVESVASSQPSHYEMRTVHVPPRHGPNSTATSMSPACFTIPVQYWQVFLHRRAAANQELTFTLARYSLIQLAFPHMEVVARIEGVMDFQNGTL